MSDLSSAPELGAAVRDVADRMRALPESRLVRQISAAEDLARHLVAWAHGIEHRDRLFPPPVPELPHVGLFVTADQVAVVGADLVAAAEGLPPQTLVWADVETRQPLTDVLSAAAAAVAAVRAEL